MQTGILNGILFGAAENTANQDADGLSTAIVISILIGIAVLAFLASNLVAKSYRMGLCYYSALSTLPRHGLPQPMLIYESSGRTPIFQNEPQTTSLNCWVGACYETVPTAPIPRRGVPSL